MKLIDKSALVAEIEKLISNGELECHQSQKNNDQVGYIAWAEHIATCIKILSVLDTLEVKEVDLEKEIDKWWCSLFTDYSMMRVSNHKFVPEPAYIDSNFKQSKIGKTKIAFELWMDWKVDSNDIEWEPDIIRNFAKHFFELGLSVNNPITAADRGLAEEIIINLKRVEQDYRIDLTKEIEWLRNQVKKGE